jgi:hypothetical protein
MNVAEIAAQLGHSLQVLLSTYAHIVDEFRGRVGVSAEDEIRATKDGVGFSKRCLSVDCSEARCPAARDEKRPSRAFPERERRDSNRRPPASQAPSDVATAVDDRRLIA